MSDIRKPKPEDIKSVSGEIIPRPIKTEKYGGAPVMLEAGTIRDIGEKSIEELESAILMLNNNEKLLQIQTMLLAIKNDQEPLIKPTLDTEGDGREYPIDESLKSIKKQLQDEEIFKQRIDELLTAVKAKLEVI